MTEKGFAYAMDIILILFLVFIISFGLIFTFIYRENKKESPAEKMGLGGTILVASLLSLPILILMGGVLFLLLGSANTVNWVFSLNISTGTLVGFVFALLIYLFTIDSVIGLFIDIIVKPPNIRLLISFISRCFGFYIIGLFFHFTDNVSIALAAGIALIVSIIELLYNLSKKRK